VGYRKAAAGQITSQETNALFVVLSKERLWVYQ
jgi:hypothetical protein